MYALVNIHQPHSVQGNRGRARFTWFMPDYDQEKMEVGGRRYENVTMDVRS